MKKASEFRTDARMALSGRWAPAIGTTLVASILGADVMMSGGGAGMPVTLYNIIDDWQTERQMVESDEDGW